MPELDKHCVAPGTGLCVYKFTNGRWSDQVGNFDAQTYPFEDYGGEPSETVYLSDVGAHFPGPSSSVGVDVCDSPGIVNGSLGFHTQIRKDTMVNLYEYIFYAMRPGTDMGAPGFPHQPDQILSACRLVNSTSTGSDNFDVECIVSLATGAPLVMSTANLTDFTLTLPSTFVLSLTVESRPEEPSSVVRMYVNGTQVSDTSTPSRIEVLEMTGDFYLGRTQYTAADDIDCGAFDGFIQTFVMGEQVEDAPSNPLESKYWHCTSDLQWFFPTDAPTVSPTPAPTGPPTTSPTAAPTTPAPPTASTTSTLVALTGGNIDAGAPAARADSDFVGSFSSASPLVLGIVLGSLVILCALIGVGIFLVRRRRASADSLATSTSIDLLRSNGVKGAPGDADGTSTSLSRGRSRRSSKSRSKSPRGGSRVRADYAEISLPPAAEPGYGVMPQTMSMNTMSTATSTDSEYRPMPSDDAAYASTAPVTMDNGYSTMPANSDPPYQAASPYNNLTSGYAKGDLKF